jgi:hypothetical protein
MDKDGNRKVRMVLDISPELKDNIRLAADKDRRSMNSLLTLLLEEKFKIPLNTKGQNNDRQ